MSTRALTLTVALALVVPGAARATDPVRLDASGEPVLDEAALALAPWQRAPDLDALDAVPRPSPAEAGAWLERRGRVARGATRELLALATLARPDGLRDDVRLRLAEALAAREAAPPTSDAALDRLLDFEPSPDLALALWRARAEQAARRGDQDGVQSALRRGVALVDAADDTLRDDWCAAANSLLPVGAPSRAAPFAAALCRDETPGWSAGPVADVADALVVLGRWRYRRGDGRAAREALSHAADRVDAPLAARCQAAVWLARSEERTGDDDAAPPRYTWVVNHCPDDDDARVRALYGLGRACADRGERACAEAWLERLLAEHPDATHGDDALFALAEMYRELGDEDAYGSTIERALSLPVDGDWWREAVWRAARSALDSDPDRAIALLERGIAAFEWDPTYYSQGRFEVVLGQLYAAQGRTAEAESVWRRALAQYPLTFWARRACDDLAAAGLACAWPERRGPIEPVAWPVSGCLAPGQRWHLLARAGLLTEAAAALAPPAGDCDAARWIRALLLDRMGDVAVAHDIPRREIVGWQREVGTAEADRRWAIAYPRPWLELVDGEAERLGLDPALIYAVMREESAFRPAVHSYAGAQGLMQLMPATARGHAEGVEGRVTVARLSEPAVNVRIGANFLAHLAARLDGEPILMVAAYNAGRGAVSRWLRDRPFDDPGLWVEAIGPRQTRDYAKRVMGSFEAYRYLYE